ncbi:shikimate-5-dehydrogenase [Cladophialophora bantiana CBS 173.52]|uniref:Shikimate-5-dehydrogenase n=1 Tax=Cladophialophora bantiana (strain ATCC 10958 / CBS 173.52 / CDC B-1940 / NIH 8579) TaxID=1442370 RepID=A0A0D2F244_CLAB1|nr:shikimate-5-dehydrogenase [Cladophialophora bantiana CBS 173.52]KIW96296.1 shikimate-5-dehydrogenase [Cladophialophora bantiana CBS 173.52]
MARFSPPDTSSYDRVAYLVGYPIAHSKSPSLHHAIYSAIGQRWGQVLCETTDLESFLTYLKSDEKCMGSGVTMPFKVAIIPYLDELTDEGKAIGAVNTIVFKTGPSGSRLYCGTNTDCLGIRDAFLTNVEGSPYREKPGLVVGGGGTCRAAVYALQQFMGCSPIYIINRDASEVEAVLQECRVRGVSDNLIYVSATDQARTLPSPGAVVSAVPNFTPVTEAEKTVREILSIFLDGDEKGAFLEMCYHPSPDTELSRLALKSGWQVIGGIEAMIGQGLAQASLWTGIEIDDRLRDVAREEVQRQMSNIH